MGSPTLAHSDPARDSLVPECALTQLLKHVILSYTGAASKLVRLAAILLEVWRHCHHSALEECRSPRSVRVVRCCYLRWSALRGEEMMMRVVLGWRAVFVVKIL